MTKISIRDQSERKMREKDEREGGGERSHKGYIHNVDRSSISFFVSNFPEDCNADDLWKVFGRFGRLGDVYIPNKVDKWGKRFAFVKFREDKEVEALINRLDDVWLGTFKLRVNRARFQRRDEEAKKKETPVHQQKPVVGEASHHFACSFKEIVGDTTRRATEKNEVLEVEVDGRILKELQESFEDKTVEQGFHHGGGGGQDGGARLPSW
jgi:RNA recognition motif-containing protein